MACERKAVTMSFQKYHGEPDSRTDYKTYIKKRVLGNLLKGLDSQPGIKANIKKKVLKYWLKKLVRQDNEIAKQSITIKELIREIADQEYNENSNKVLLVEFNWYHGECIPGFYKYLSDLNYDVDLLVNEGLLKEKAFDVIKCNHIYNCDIELMGLLLQYVLIEQYQFVIFNSNAFTWKGGWHTVLQEFPLLFKYLDKIYVLEHQLEYLNKDLLEIGHVFFLTDKLSVDKRMVPVNCHWFGNTSLPRKNKVTRFITVGAIDPVRRNFKALSDAVEFLYNHGIKNFHITVIGLGKLDVVNPAIRRFFTALGRVPYSTVHAEMRKADFFLTLLDPGNPDHDRYITHGTSGSFQLIYGFSKPCLIAGKFADIYGFSPENAVVYSDNSDLGLSMWKAIDMSDAEYEGIRNNLIRVSDDIYNKSLENLKKALSDN